jgi:transposase
VTLGTRLIRPEASREEDSYGTTCGNRRVFKLSSVCIVDTSGKIVRETKVASEPEALIAFFKGLSVPVTRIGLEAGPLSQWLHAELLRAGFEAVLLETRHFKAALSAMSTKTDATTRAGSPSLCEWAGSEPYTPNRSARERCERCSWRASSCFQSLWILRQACGASCGDLVKMGVVTRKGFEARVRELSAGQAMLERITNAMLDARAALWREFEQLHREMLRIVRDDEICRRLMSIPGVGPLVAVTFKSAIDNPGSSSRNRSARCSDWSQEIPIWEEGF